MISFGYWVFSQIRKWVLMVCIYLYEEVPCCCIYTSVVIIVLTTLLVFVRLSGLRGNISKIISAKKYFIGIDSFAHFMLVQ